jgi:uncharacterized protein (DUF58 family)
VTPLLILIAALVVLTLLGYLVKIYPHRPLVLLALVPAASSLALMFLPGSFWPLLALDGLLLIVALMDLAMLPRQAAFLVQRETQRIVSLGKHHDVMLLVNNHSRRRQTIWLRDALPISSEDGTPGDFVVEPDHFLLRLEPRKRAVVHYRLSARRRGAFQVDRAYLRVRSPCGLWQRVLEYRHESTLHVYPDMRQLAEYAVLARTNRLSLLGVRRTRRVGQDNEFERLRDYTLDDNYKFIDWRTTARRQKLTVKDFQANQSQRLIFLLDCGRMMTNTASGLSLLDHALNAMLMLSYVALRQGDSVGLLTFSDTIHGYVPPRGGLNQMNRLLHASFDTFPHLVESRYDQAFLYLAGHCRKRSLVILITNLIDEVNSSQVEQYLSHLVGRHLPLGVLLRDHQLFAPVQKPPESSAELFQAAAAADILTWRDQVISDLVGKGVLALDAFPEEMTAPLINRYLDVKARHLL